MNEPARDDFTDIQWLSPHEMEITWADGHRSRYTLDFLELNCPCAACQGHGEHTYKELPAELAAAPRQRVPETKVMPVGNYAMGIHFHGGCTTGIFSYRFLRHLDDIRSSRA